MLIWPEPASPAYPVLLTKRSFQFVVKSLFSNPSKRPLTLCWVTPSCLWLNQQQRGRRSEVSWNISLGRSESHHTANAWTEHKSICITRHNRIWSIFCGITMSHKVLPFKRKEKCKRKKKTRLNLTLTLLISLTSFNLISCSEASQDDLNHLPHLTANSSDLWWIGTMLDWW